MPSSLLASSVLLLAAPCAALVLSRAPPPSAVRSHSPRMLFGGGGKEGEGGGLNMMETIKKAQAVGVKVKELQEDCRKYEAQIESLKDQDVEFKVINARIETRLDAIDANIAEIKILLKERLKK